MWLQNFSLSNLSALCELDGNSVLMDIAEVHWFATIYFCNLPLEIEWNNFAMLHLFFIDFCGASGCLHIQNPLLLFFGKLQNPLIK